MKRLLGLFLYNHEIQSRGSGEVIIEDKQAQEQLRLISELDKDDQAIIFKMIDKMLTSQKFKEFFAKNVASL